MSARPNSGRRALAAVSDTLEQRVGARVREFRTQLNISQDALARQMQTLGYSWKQATVAKTEAAQRPLRLNELADLANVLGVTLPDLLGTEEDEERAAVIRQIAGARAALTSLHQREREVSRELAAVKQDIDYAEMELQMGRCLLADTEPRQAG